MSQRHEAVGVQTSDVSTEGSSTHFQGVCSCGFRTFQSRDIRACQRALDRHIEESPKPFCIAQFEAWCESQDSSDYLRLRIAIAASRFEKSPCPCQACTEVSGNIDQHGGRS